MKTLTMVETPVNVEVNPGDRVILNIHKDERYQKKSVVYKMVETSSGVYAVFTNGTWRPMRTYYKTWRKVGL